LEKLRSAGLATVNCLFNFLWRAVVSWNEKNAGNEFVYLGPITGNDDVVGCHLTGLALDLDPFLQILFELRHIQDLVVHGGRAIQHEFDNALFAAAAAADRFVGSSRSLSINK
jgi:hypothetical protein